MSRPGPATTPVVFCSDRTFAPYAAVATLSLMEKSQNPVLIYWIVRPEDVGYAEELRARLPQGVHRIEIMGVDDSAFAGWGEHFHVTRGAYIRLLIPDLLPHDRALYLDGDVLVLSDIGPLLATDLQGCPIGGVANRRSEELPPPTVCSDTFINSGVLLMDLAALRRDRFFDTCEGIYRGHKNDERWMDQEVINVYAEGRKCLLDPRWNSQVRGHQTSDSDWQALLQSGQASIVHFLGVVKPWQEWCNPAIARDWKHFADKIGLGPEHYQQIKAIKHGYFKAMMHDLNGEFDAASALKERIIARLLKLTPAKRLTGARIPFGLEEKPEQDGR